MQQTVELWEEGANNEELAYERQKSEGIKNGLIGVRNLSMKMRHLQQQFTVAPVRYLVTPVC